MDKDLLAELNDMFLTEMTSRVNRLGKYVRERNAREVQRLAHQIHGVGGTYNHQSISDAGAEIEVAVKTGKWDRIESALKELEVLVSSK